MIDTASPGYWATSKASPGYWVRAYRRKWVKSETLYWQYIPTRKIDHFIDVVCRLYGFEADRFKTRVVSNAIVDHSVESTWSHIYYI